MYIRISNPKFLELGDSGRPAAGYRVYTLVAGTVDTLVTTYSDKDLTSANANPIVLDARGEADIFTDVAVKLVYTSPTGDLTSPIWTEDYVTEQQSDVSDRGDGVWIGNNNYTLDKVPTYTSVGDGFSLVMIPDTTCLDTLVTPVGASSPTVFTGTGINDGLYSGRYIGSTAGAIFAVTIDTCYIVEPVAGPTATVSADVAATPPAGGDHLIAITYISAEGETLIGPYSTVTADGVHKIDLAVILLGPADKGITGRRIYMTIAGGADFYYVDELADVVTATYKIDIDDVALAGNAAAPVANDTGSGSGADTFSWQIDAGAATAGVPILNTGPQTLQDGLFIEFSNVAGHLIGDVWTVEVMTPVRLNFCSLGNKLGYKSEGGALVVLDGADIIANYPAHWDYSADEDCWILINPSLPVLSSLIPLRRRKEITANYTIDPVTDQGLEINATGALTVTLPDCVDAVAHFFYVRNGGTGVVTVDAGTYTIKGIEASTLLLYPNVAVQLATNGIDWHILTITDSVPVGTISMYGGDTAPFSYLLCDGSSYLRADYVDLFAVIGTAFGAGGAPPNTFAVPDLRSRFPYGANAIVVVGTAVGGGAEGVLASEVAHGAGPPAVPGILLDADVSGADGWAVGVDPIATIAYQAVNFIIKY